MGLIANSSIDESSRRSRSSRFIILNLLAGYQHDFVKTNNKFEHTNLNSTDWFTDTVRETVALPLLQLMCKHCDFVGHLETRKWRYLFEEQNNGSWYSKNLAKMRVGGSFDLHHIDRLSTVNNPDRPGDMETARFWVSGIPYEIALVLNFLRTDFPTPNNENLYRMSIAKKARFLNRHITDREGDIPQIRPLNNT